MGRFNYHRLQSLIKPWHALVVLILLNLLIAAFIGNDFGEAWDEPNFYLYGERSLDAYRRGISGLDLIPNKHIFFVDLRYYGPFYAVVGKLMTDGLMFVLKNWEPQDIWHLVNFSFFQTALVSLYYIARRFMKDWSAVGTVFLFSTQPLIFGHAFINPKDIPFMTFFLASISLGLAMADRIEKYSNGQMEQASNPGTSLFSSYGLFAAIFFALFVLTIVSKDVIASIIGWGISYLYYAPSGSVAGRVFSLLADQANRLPVESYIHKGIAAHIDRLMIAAVFFGITIRKWLIEYKKNKNIPARLKPDLRLVLGVLIAGVLLGLTTSVRLLGPFAGILVAGYILLTSGGKSLPFLIVYFSIAAICTYLAWPFLWDQPTYNFLEALHVMRNFPYTGEVRFMGDNIGPSNLPWTYVPILISIQITEPVVGLAWIGFLVSIIMSVKNTSIPPKTAFILLWLLVPVGLQILLGSSIYDNFRQFLFILPPMFILAGVGWEALTGRIKYQSLKVVIFILCAAPGWIGIASLHPYQYIYYNTFVGGVSGAEGRFETDYWLTSYRETTDFLNKNASPNAKILAWGASYNVRRFSRNDLAVFDFNSEDEIHEAYDYAVISTRFDNHINLFQTAEIVFEVRKNGVLLAVVKKLAK